MFRILYSMPVCHLECSGVACSDQAGFSFVTSQRESGGQQKCIGFKNSHTNMFTKMTNLLAHRHSYPSHLGHINGLKRVAESQNGPGLAWILGKCPVGQIQMETGISFQYVIFTCYVSQQSNCALTQICPFLLFVLGGKLCVCGGESKRLYRKTCNGSPTLFVDAFQKCCLIFLFSPEPTHQWSSQSFYHKFLLWAKLSAQNRLQGLN